MSEVAVGRLSEDKRKKNEEKGAHQREIVLESTQKLERVMNQDEDRCERAFSAAKDDRKVDAGRVRKRCNFDIFNIRITTQGIRRSVRA